MNALTRHAFDACIVVCAIAVLLFTALGAGTGQNAADAPLPPPPPLGELGTMVKAAGTTLYSLDTVTQGAGKSIVTANRPPAVSIAAHLPATLVGWTVDAPRQRAAQAVFILVDGRVATSCSIGTARPDVAGAYNNYAYVPSGFSCTIPASSIAAGRHAIELDVALQGEHSFYVVDSPTALVAR